MPLPTFMIIGVAKAGTTSLFRYLDQHPQVFMCPLKGTNYFGYEDAMAWPPGEGEQPMLRNFPVRTFDDYQASFGGANGARAIGEASPQYFRCPTAAWRIRQCLPHVKLVASLRNPADRAFSGFLMRTRRGERVKSAYEELTSQSSHVVEGFYYRRLKRYFALFPKNQLKVFLFEDFKKDPTAVLVDLFEFLGVDPSRVPDTSVAHNPAGVPRSRLLNRIYFNPAVIRAAKAILPAGVQGLGKHIRNRNLQRPPKCPADLRAELLKLYREDILKLESLLDRDLSGWLAER